jgi:MbtH protein
VTTYGDVLSVSFVLMNPFDDPDSPFLVLVNHEDQHSLWPARMVVPEGWSVVHGEADRQSCLDYVDEHWTDLSPLSTRSR